MSKLKDRYFGLGGLALFGFLLYSLRGKGFQTRAFPTALILILMLLCLVFIFRRGHEEKYDFSAAPQVLIYGGLLALYVLAMPFAGFILSTTAFLAAFLLLQKYPMKKIYIVLFAAATALLLWLLFAKGFGVRLPEILF